MNCTIQLNWNALTEREADRLLSYLRGNPWENPETPWLTEREAERFRDDWKRTRLKPHAALSWLADVRPGIETQSAPSDLFLHSIDYYASVMPFFRHLAAEFPTLCAEVRGCYEPDPVNLAKGYDDLGGVFEIRMYKGAFWEADTPIV